MLYSCHSSEHVVPRPTGSWAIGSVPVFVAGSWCPQSDLPLTNRAPVPGLGGGAQRELGAGGCRYDKLRHHLYAWPFD